MAKPEIQSAKLKWHDYSAASVLNLEREEFGKWCRDLEELPEGARIIEDEIVLMYEAFQQVADAARAQVAGTLDDPMVRSLGETVDNLFLETCLRPKILSLGKGDDLPTAAWRPEISWAVVYSDDRAFFPKHAVELFIDALETLCGYRHRRYGVCQAPARDNPDEPCGNLFLRERIDAIYCSAACRKQVQRGK